MMGISEMHLLMAPRNIDYPGKKRAKRKLNPELNGSVQMRRDDYLELVCFPSLEETKG